MQLKPRLRFDAQLFAYRNRWRVRSGSENRTIPIPNQFSDPEFFLDRLDGFHTVEEIAEECLVPLDSARCQIEKFNQLGLLTWDEPACEFKTVARRTEGGSLTEEEHRDRFVLQIGLGPLGINLLEALLRIPRIAVNLFDPARVCYTDLGSYYQKDHLGMLRTDVVADTWKSTSRVRVAPFHDNPAQDLEHSLGAWVKNAELVLCCIDQPWYMPVVLERICQSARVPFLPVEVTEDGARLGPLGSSGQSAIRSGCYECTFRYESGNDTFSSSLTEFLKHRFPFPARWRFQHPRSVTRGISKLAMLAITEMLQKDRTRRESLVLSLSHPSASIQKEPARKHYSCRACYPQPERTLPALENEVLKRWSETFHAQVALPSDPRQLLDRLLHTAQGEPKLFDSSHSVSVQQRRNIYRFYRSRSIDPVCDPLANSYKVLTVRRACSPTGVVEILSEAFDLEDPDRAQALSLVEGLERLFALDYCPKNRIVKRRFAEITRSALDPRTFPLYSEEQYRRPGFPLRRFTPELETDWVFAMNLTGERPQLVPANLIFASGGSTTIYLPNSNGAACHSSFHRAVIAAIYETIERDSLMVVWLNRLSLPRISLDDSSPKQRGIAQSLEALGFHLELIDITTDLGVPVLLGVLRDTLDPDLFLLSMAASSDPRIMLQRLLNELAQFLLPYLMGSWNSHNELSTSDNPDLVKGFPDHLAFYQNRNKRELTAFLTASQATKDINSMDARGSSDDPKAEIRDLTARLQRKGYEVLVVDGTTTFLKELGLYAVKILIPGLQPLHCGYRFRVLGGSRLYQMRRLMGLEEDPATQAVLNPWPHPFW